MQLEEPQLQLVQLVSSSISSSSSGSSRASSSSAAAAAAATSPSLGPRPPARDRRKHYHRCAAIVMPDDPSDADAPEQEAAKTAAVTHHTTPVTTSVTTTTHTPRMTRAAGPTNRTLSLPEGADLERLAAASTATLINITGNPKSAIRCKKNRPEGTNRSVSIADPLVPGDDSKARRSSGDAKKGAHGYTPPRSPTSPGSLLTKVKERIREKVFMSSEWPNSAVMMQEKRQRANDALNASLQTRREVELQVHSKKKGRKSSEGARYEVIERNPNITSKSEVRQSFIRRRSISEDTYDRGLLMQMKSDILDGNEEQAASTSTEHKSEKSGLPFGVRLKRSPRPVKKHMRTQSLDSGKTGMCKTYIDPNVAFTSTGSSQSTLSSLRTLDSVASGSSNSVRYEYTELHNFTQILPEIVLDKSAKETILEEANGEYDVDEDGKKLPQPVPDIVFDENGQTWDVYGADFDPEILGHAIQRHLERLMSTASQDDEVTAPLCQGQGQSSDADRSSQSSFWLRLLCMFTSKETINS